jgi:TM2 domain-containing membrane protein YozV
MQQLNSGTAYILWCLCLLGICGIQRFYTGQVGIGLLYLFTFGLCGIGQLADLALIPGAVEARNTYLRGLHGGNATANATASVNQTINLNLSDIPQLRDQLQTVPASASAALTPMQRLLKAAKDNGGQLSIAQAAMHTELEPEQVKALLHEATKAGYADVMNDSKTGAVRYHFDV